VLLLVLPAAGCVVVGYGGGADGAVRCRDFSSHRFPDIRDRGWLFSHVVVFGNIAWRMSLLSVVATALSAWLLYRCACKLGCGAMHAACTALVFAAAPIVCQHATRAGVDALAALLVVASFTCALEGFPVRAALFSGFALGAHPSTMWMLPGVAIVAVASLRRSQVRIWQTAAVAALAFCMGLSVYAYLPIRSAIVTKMQLDPTANLALDYHPIWDYDHPVTSAGFVRLVTGADFGASGAIGIMLQPAGYGSYVTGFVQTLNGQFTAAGVILAVVGLIAQRRRPSLACGLLVAAFGIFPFARTYAQMGILTDAPKYYLVALWVTTLAIGMGAAAFSRAFTRLGKPLRAIGLVALLAIAVVSAGQSRQYVAQRDDHSAEAIIASVARLTPDDAIIATPWWYATPLFYAAYAEKSLGHRRIITNVGHADIAALATIATVYYVPLPENDIAFDGVTLDPVAGAWRAMYRVIPKR
jgi:hypothetical protein